jgi:hypothetical protein
LGGLIARASGQRCLPIVPDNSDYRAVHHDYSDGVHEVCFVDGGTGPSGGHFEPKCGPDYESLEHGIFGAELEEDKVSFSDMSACLVLILQWILGGKTLALVGARAAALAVYLDPVHNSKFGSNLAQIAASAGVTKACLSKSLIDFRDAVGLHLSAGKSEGARAKYRQTQINCVAAGNHSSVSRKDANLKRRAKLAGADV